MLPNLKAADSRVANTEFEPNDVEIAVFAWDKGGAKINRVVAFDWRCLVAVSWAVT